MSDFLTMKMHVSNILKGGFYDNDFVYLLNEQRITK